jgi:aminopeptidase N
VVGNNITTKDIADMWVHEGFTSYSEVLFTEYHFGKTTRTNTYRASVKALRTTPASLAPTELTPKVAGTCIIRDLILSIPYAR